MSPPIGRLLAGAGLLIIAAMTLVPIPHQAWAAQLTPWWCLVCGDHAGVDVVDNILLFIPFGLGLRLAGLPVARAAAVAALVSLSIELLQGTVVPGRDASLSDVLTNTCGGWIGALIGEHYSTFLRPTRARAVRLAVTGGALWLVIQTGTAILLQPWTPAGDLRGIWARKVSGHPVFDGQIVEAVLAGHHLPRDSQPIAPELAQALREGRFDLRVRLIAGGAVRESPVLEVLGSRGAVLALEANGSDLAFQPPMRSSFLRLARPSLRLEGALPLPGATLSLTAQDRGSALRADWTSSGVRHQASQLLSPSLGWSLLMPFHYSYGPETTLLTMIWIAAWLLPVGYWTAHVSGRAFLYWVATLLLLLSGLSLVPSLTGYSPVHWSEWLGGLLGLAAGAAGHHGATYFEARCDSRSTSESC